jgi:hypothetical protein
MTCPRARNIAIAGITIVSASLLTALFATGASAAATAAADPGHTAGPASAVVQAAPARAYIPAQPVPNAFRLENAHSGLCVSEDGDTGLVALGTCNTNHSQYWYFSNPGPLVNAHSGKCLQIDGYSTTVPISAANCDFDDSQNWQQDFGSLAGSFMFVNLHSGLCLQGQGTVLYQGGGNDCADSGYYETILNWYER